MSVTIETVVRDLEQVLEDYSSRWNKDIDVVMGNIETDLTLDEQIKMAQDIENLCIEYKPLFEVMMRYYWIATDNEMDELKVNVRILGLSQLRNKLK